ncbi:MAG: NAD(P)-dependent oxidoreductase [Planctomycetes bacterium]|nr:NAD(P)-dependent oxidoreductase [Planctomycetota bacterium]MCH2585680.1 NAD(P)-dependent oxidoreductase [Planctomycetota bacterium]
MSRAPGDGRSATGMIGLGLLGSAITQRLLEHGLEVVGFDIEPGRALELGIETADSPAQLAARVERIVLCLPDSDAVEEVCGGSAGLLSAAASRLELVIDCTTGDPDRSEALAGRMGGAGIAFVEAEVSGSSELMLSGEAALLVGAEPGSLEAAAELLDALSPVVFHLGPVGAGAKMKLVSNLAVGLNRLVLAEALYLAERGGVEPGALLEVLRAGPGHSRAGELKGGKMVKSDYSPEARLAQHLKDVELILDLGDAAGADLPLSRLHRELLARGVEEGLGELDNSSIIEVLRNIPAREDGGE